MQVEQKAQQAKQTSRKLAQLSNKKRNQQLAQIADKIDNNREGILSANRSDLKEAEKLLQQGEYTQPLVDRLKLSQKMDGLVEMVHSVKQQTDLLGQVQTKRKLAQDLQLSKMTTPLGVLGVIFESRPDALVQIAALAMKSGNSVILKGGSEAKQSNNKLYNLIKEATDIDGWIQLIDNHEEVDKMLELDSYIDLIIPRGSKSLVRFIQDNTSIQVLGHAEGLCHIYLHSSAKLDMALDIILDAKTDYPAACNAVEALLVDQQAREKLPEIISTLQDNNIELRGCEQTREVVDIKSADQQDWKQEYNDLILSVKMVEDVQGAIDHINNYGSGHTDSIIAQDQQVANKFLQAVDSSSVMHNASTRFADGFRYGLGAEVGISTGKTHARGPVGLEGLTTYKYVLRGNGQKVAELDKQDYLHESFDS